jgi:hypothetical protein
MSGQIKLYHSHQIIDKYFSTKFSTKDLQNYSNIFKQLNIHSNTQAFIQATTSPSPFLTGAKQRLRHLLNSQAK